MGAGELSVAAASYGLGCRACGTINQILGTSSSFDCATCARRNFTVDCQRCHGARVITGRGRQAPTGWTCHWCLHQTANVGLSHLARRGRATAADAWTSLRDHGLTDGDARAQVLGGFETVAGSGDAPPPGTVSSVTALTDGVLVVAEIGAEGRTLLPYPDLLELEADGRGLLTTGGRYIGGGRGLTGAITGMAVASMLNNATRKTQIDSYLRITTPQSQMLLRHWHYTPDEVRAALSRMFAAQLAAARAASTPPPVVINPPSPERLSSGPIDELERLTKLHAAGTLTDTEFEAARAKQIKLLHASKTT